MTNFNDLSSDHNPILISINAAQISNLPPNPTTKTHWNKFYQELLKHEITVHNQFSSTSDIDNDIGDLTSLITQTMANCSYTSTPLKTPVLPPEITLEIETKRILRKLWQRTHDPTYKRLYNAQIVLVKNLLTSHRNREWDKFSRTLNLKDNSIHKPNRKPQPTPHLKIKQKNLSSKT